MIKANYQLDINQGVAENDILWYVYLGIESSSIIFKTVALTTKLNMDTTMSYQL